MNIVLEEDESLLDEVMVIGYGVASKSARRRKNRSNDSGRNYEKSESSASAAADYDFTSVAVRKIFSESLAFEPFLYPENNEVKFTFKTSDKLSTYHVFVLRSRQGDAQRHIDKGLHRHRACKSLRQRSEVSLLWRRMDIDGDHRRQFRRGDRGRDEDP